MAGGCKAPGVYGRGRSVYAGLMALTSIPGKIARSSLDEIPAPALDWIRRPAPLTELCRFGGWPDDSSLTVELYRRTPRQWIVNICFDETIMEISECDVTRRQRCGQFAVSFDAAGSPVGIRMIQPL